MSSAPNLEHAGRWAGRGLCVATAVLWSTSGLFIKTLTAESGAGWSGWQVAGARSLFAGITLLALGRIWPRRAAADEVPVAPPRSPWLPDGRQVILAIFYAGTLLTYVLAQTFTTTANAIFLQYSAPVYILFLSPWLLREKPKAADLLSLPVLIVGIFVILSAELQFGHGTFGNVMALVSGVGYALVMLLMRKWRNAGAAGGIALGNFFLAAIGIGIACGSAQGFVWPGLRSGAQILWLGVFQIGLAYFLFQGALLRITAVEASLLCLIEPMLCPLWAWFFAADVPPRNSVLGAGIILLTLAANTVWKARTET
ncbi:MAG: DMT family transporter [Candidatus Brocadiia bacterium]